MSKRAVTARNIRHAFWREGGAPVFAGQQGSSATAAATAAIGQGKDQEGDHTALSLINARIEAEKAAGQPPPATNLETTNPGAEGDRAVGETGDGTSAG
eukprot:8340268-Ditylum_brightwellii.AAC.1